MHYVVVFFATFDNLRGFHFRGRPNFGFSFSTETRRKVSFSEISISVRCTIASFGFNRSRVVLALS